MMTGRTSSHHVNRSAGLIADQKKKTARTSNKKQFVHLDVVFISRARGQERQDCCRNFTNAGIHQPADSAYFIAEVEAAKEYFMFVAFRPLNRVIRNLNIISEIRSFFGKSRFFRGLECEYENDDVRKDPEDV